MSTEFNPPRQTVDRLSALKTVNLDALVEARREEREKRYQSAVIQQRHPDGTSERGYGDSERRDRTSRMIMDLRRQPHPQGIRSHGRF